MNTITVSKSEISSIVSELQTQKNTIDGYTETLKNEVDCINNAWKGSDAILYTEKMKNDYSVLLEDFSKCLQSYIDFLNKVYDEYEKHDNTFADETIGV